MTLELDRAVELATLSGLVLTAADAAEALFTLARVGERVVEGSTGVSVTTRQHGTSSSSAWSNEGSRDLDALQIEVQEGPCLDCLREGSVMRVVDFATDARFPVYGPRAAALGAVAVVSVPLTADGRTVGALNVYGGEGFGADQDVLATCLLVAAHGQLGLQAALAYQASRRLATQLQEALTSRVLIEQAKGVLMATLGCDADAAFTHLVERSQQTNTRLQVVAQQVLASVA